MPHFNLRYFLETLGKQKSEDVFVLQVGAMDGKTFDPIHEFVTKFHWHGLMVEPIKEHFKVLQTTYQNQENISFENVAIAEQDGEAVMHYIPAEHVANGNVPKWGCGVSSFYNDRNALAFEEVSEYVQQRQVPCITLKSLLSKHQVKRIDVLQIDAEGHDYNILKQLDFTCYRPKVINFEIVNLPKQEQGLCKKILDAQGYIYIKGGYDLMAVSLEYLKEI